MVRTATEIATLMNAQAAPGRGVAVETVERILEHGTLRRFEVGEFVTRRGQVEPRVCLMLEGTVRLTAFTEDGREMLTHIVREGDYWGVHPCLGGYVETNDAVVETESEIVLLAPPAVDWLMTNRQDFQKAMIAILCRRLNLALSLAEQMSNWSARERLAWRLLLLASGEGLDDSAAFNPEIAISQEALASMVNLSRQRTNRILKTMEEEGLVSLAYGRITIRDRSALREVVESAR